ncbi:unnamed protein product [Thelazia callipaeda]|uniref:SER_THR_PHOSPHATASE domain-containing protein n=1 Tax=Thelazia callipaeda TaxID=103827 RepID=A0A0N5CVA0_THECL|nr:unnamed protein product [Thelazia callipaeda]
MVDSLRQCGTLEYIHNSERVAIFGDLHGSLYDLFRRLKDAGWPTEKTLIFLGDYIDHGKVSFRITLPQTCIYVTWQSNTVNQCYANEENESGLVQNIENYYASADTKLITVNSNFVFDHLPLAVILSDQVLLCHGGISQYLKSRNDIAQIPRTLAPELNLLHSSIMTDISWADPYKEINGSKYKPSGRVVSYYFNRRALKEKLRVLNCRALIRGHEANASFRWFMLYYIHSSSAAGDEYCAAAILLVDFDKTTNLLRGSVVYHSTKGNLEHLREKLAANFARVSYSMDNHSFFIGTAEIISENVFNQNLHPLVSFKFMDGVAAAIFKWQRFISHFDLFMTTHQDTTGYVINNSNRSIINASLLFNEYRTGNHSIQLEKGFFDDMDAVSRNNNINDLHKAAALVYPKFLNVLIKQRINLNAIITSIIDTD